MNSRISLILILILSPILAASQNNNYFVQFKDKINSPYSVDRPEEFLSARAIERRSRQQIVVTLEDLPINPSYLLTIEGIGNLSVRETSKWMNGALIQATPAEAESLKLLSIVKDVEFTAPANIGGRLAKNLDIESLTESDSDTLFQFDIHDIGQMRADGYQGENMLIAVMDGGFQGLSSIPAFTHLYNNLRVILAYNFITRSSEVYQDTDHGTKVMSLLAAENEEPNYAGVVPKASFMLFVTEDIHNEYRLEEYRWLVAAEKADSAGVDVISTSIGYNLFDDPSMNYLKSDLDGRTAVISRAAQKAADKGILVITSGGNTGSTDPWENVLFPGDIIDGLSIGSITSGYTPTNFSPIGPSADNRIKPDVMAYGSGLYVINKFGNIVTTSGTSFSTPVVAGLATGVWERFYDRNLSSKDLVMAFRNSSSNSSMPNNNIGYGVPSYTALVNYLEAEESTTWFSYYPNPVVGDDYLRIRVFDPVQDRSVRLTMFNSLGNPIAHDNLNITWQDNEYFLELATLPRGIYILNLQSNNNFSKIKILKL